jgi:pyruvate,water dikinase
MHREIQVKVNVSIPAAADKAAATGAGGVGLLRIEHMITSLRQHPRLYLTKGQQEEYVNELVKGISRVGGVFFPKPVWARTLDAPTDEFREMPGGEEEPLEANPMLGWRGLRRDLDWKEHFDLELRAIRTLREQGLTNVGLMLPMVQHPEEVQAAKELMTQNGLDPQSFPWGIMLETPASILLLEEFIREGIHFFSLGTNDLVQFTLAVDRGNERLKGLYNEFHPAVLRLIREAIEVGNRHGIESSVCGEAGSNPQMARVLMDYGISSISANIDAVKKVKELVAAYYQIIA